MSGQLSGHGHRILDRSDALPALGQCQPERSIRLRVVFGHWESTRARTARRSTDGHASQTLGEYNGCDA